MDPKLGNLFNNFLDLLKKPSPVLCAILAATSLMLFSPDEFLEKIFLLEFRDKYSLYLGIVFVITSAILFIFLIIAIYKLIKKMISIRILKIKKINYLKSLNKEQHEIVAKLYIKENHSAYLDINEVAISALISTGIISHTSISKAYTYFPCMLSDWVIKYINNQKDYLNGITSCNNIPKEFIDPFVDSY